MLKVRPAVPDSVFDWSLIPQELAVAVDSVRGAAAQTMLRWRSVRPGLGR